MMGYIFHICLKGEEMFFSYERGNMDGNEAIGMLFKFLSDHRSNISKIEINEELVDGIANGVVIGEMLTGRIKVEVWIDKEVK